MKTENILATEENVGVTESATSNRRIAELETALAKCNEELTAMIIAKTAADEEIARLTAQGQKDRDEIEAHKRRIHELETHQIDNEEEEDVNGEGNDNNDGDDDDDDDYYYYCPYEEEEDTS